MVRSNTRNKLSDKEVRSAKPKEQEYSLSDGDRLYLKIKPGGSKLWVFNYYKPFCEPPQRSNLGFGKYPDITLAQARALADECRALLAQDIDPKSHREQRKQQRISENKNTFKVVAEDWFNTKYKPTVLEKTALKTWARFENYLFPKLENHFIGDIKPSYLIELLKPIDARGQSDTLFRLIGLVNNVLNHGVNSGLIEFNYCEKVGSAFTQRPHEHHPTIAPDELPSFLSALNNSNRDLVTKLLVKWLLLTMVRASEAVSVEWSEIDWDNKLWNIPKEKMKGRKNEKRPHDVPLSAQALMILDKMKTINGHRKYVFTHYSDPNRSMSSQTPNNAIKRLDDGRYKGLLVAHGLRSIASTYLHDMFTEESPVVEACLSHISGDQTKNSYYRGQYLARRKAIMQAWGDYVEKCSIVPTII